jgi:gamma-glutamyl-gamma-aminobutyrate hydrolase PuuD
MRVVRDANHGEIRDALSHDWIEWLSRHEHVGIPVPNRLADPAGYLRALDVDCLVLTGGNDLIVRPRAVDETAPERDRTEAALVGCALEEGRPIFATCRGLHFLNQYFGGGLRADLRSGTGGKINHVGSTHPVMLSDPFMELAGRELIETNSFHDQGVGRADLASALRAFAVSPEDDVIEGLFHPRHAVLAIQWHPERANPARDFDSRLFECLLAGEPPWRQRDEP